MSRQREDGLPCEPRGPGESPSNQDLRTTLAPRDREVIRALVQYHWLEEADIAVILKIGLNNFKKRRSHAYRVLHVTNRLELYVNFPPDSDD